MKFLTANHDLTGNMHEFSAMSSCAVLDILAPPYDTHDAGKHLVSFQFTFSAHFHSRESCIFRLGTSDKLR